MSGYTVQLLQDTLRHGLLVTGGPAPAPSLLQETRAQFPEVPFFCADAGAELCRAANVVPDALIGDMDSLSAETRAWLEAMNVPELVYPAEKDYTDTQLAIEALFDRDVEEIIVLGALGGRLDHELANLMLLMQYGRAGRSLVFLDDVNCIRYVGPGVHEIDRTEDYISVIPFSDGGMCLSIEGLHYPLDHYSVPFGESRLISNVFTDALRARYIIERGDGLFIFSHDRIKNVE